MSYYVVFHHTVCEHCGVDLTKEMGVTVSFSCAEHVFERFSTVNADGRLRDLDDLVQHGYHAGTCCGKCGELLEELDSSGLVIEE